MVAAGGLGSSCGNDARVALISLPGGLPEGRNLLSWSSICHDRSQRAQAICWLSRRVPRFFSL